ncbi:MAG: hypothetical protein OXF27_18135 [Acidobacteria bacterium]|nr:hypothetical protein [Acidobacteriota bacterium]
MTRIRERIAIHSSKQPDPNWKALAAMLENEATPQDCMDSPRGTIIGTVELADCIDVSEEPTFVGPYGWVLARPPLLNKPIQARGNTGTWRVPPDIARRLR